MNTQRRTAREGLSSLELAIVAPILLFFVLVCMQFAVIFLTNLSVLNAARNVSRWISVHPHTTDANVVASLQSWLPPELQPQNMTVTIMPSCIQLTQQKCPNRPPNADLTITLRYNISSLFFLPKQFSLGNDLTVAFPSTLSDYTMRMKVETP